MEKGHPLWGCPFGLCGRSAALLDGGIHLRDVHRLLDVVHPVVVADVGRGRARQAEHGGGHTAGDDCGKSELLHFGAFFFLRCGVANLLGSNSVVPVSVGLFDRYDSSNREVKGLIPLAVIDRRLARIAQLRCAHWPKPVSMTTPVCTGSQLNSAPCRSSIIRRAARITATGRLMSHAPSSSSCTASASTPASITGTGSRSTPRASTCGRWTSSATA